MPTQPKATILLIHGGWHTPTHYASLIKHLQSHGHEVHCPRLPSANGVRPPNADLSSDTALIRSYASSLISAGRKLIAQQNQSPSGGGGTGGGGIARLIYITSFALSPGQSMMGLVREMGHGELIPLAFEIHSDGVVWDRDPVNRLLGEEGARELGEAATRAFVDSLVVWNGAGMEQVLEGCAWSEEGVGVSYVTTTVDTEVPLSYQSVMIERMREAGKEVEVFELPTGHCPQVTKARELGEIVLGIVGREVGRW